MSHDSILILNIAKLLALISVNLLDYFAFNNIVTLNENIFAFFYKYTIWPLHEVTIPKEKRIFDNVFDDTSLVIERTHPIHDFNWIIYLNRIRSGISCKLFLVKKDLLTDLIDDYKCNFTMFTYNLNLISIYLNDISMNVCVVKNDISNFVHHICTVLLH